jgi:anti-sigma factor ChrR (cupin superfamily)
MVSDDGELERLRREAAELRALVRELSARQAAAVSALPLEAALALAKGGEAGLEPPFRLENWNETIEMTRADVASEMALLWRRLPPRANA